MKLAIVNLGQIVSGDWRDPFVAGDTILTDGDRIMRVGTASFADVEEADVVIDAGGRTAIPGLIDSHGHITFGSGDIVAERCVLLMIAAMSGLPKSNTEEGSMISAPPASSRMVRITRG